MFIKNWANMHKSLAVILPTAASIVIVVADIYLQADLVPEIYIPIVVAISGYLGRIIQQPKLGADL